MFQLLGIIHGASLLEEDVYAHFNPDFDQEFDSDFEIEPGDRLYTPPPNKFVAGLRRVLLAVLPSK